MRSNPNESESRADAIKELEKRWLLKSKENENKEEPVIINRKKIRTSLTNPVDKNYSLPPNDKK